MLPPPDEGLVDWIHVHLATLYEYGLGTRLVDSFGGPAAVLSRSPRVLASSGVQPAVIARLKSAAVRAAAIREHGRARAEGVALLCWSGADYPEPLKALPAMPLLLFARGWLPPADASPAGWGPGVGVVGSRRPSLYGVRQARRFAGALARRGFAIVSGLAAGIDGEAHRAALAAGGRTIAVLGSGLGKVYPREHSGLAREIAAHPLGLLLSEFPFDAAPRSFHFPLRNRILSGLSAAILVVEAGERSGSLITVRHALEQGRAVYIVPGRVDSPESLGCLRLLADGAAPAIEPDDVLPGVEPAGRRAAATAPAGAGTPGGPGSRADAFRKEVDGPLAPGIDLLFAEEDAWHPDHIAERLGLDACVVVAELSRLELEGYLVRVAGGLYART
jgi:DNA processing protein